PPYTGPEPGRGCTTTAKAEPVLAGGRSLTSLVRPAGTSTYIGLGAVPFAGRIRIRTAPASNGADSTRREVCSREVRPSATTLPRSIGCAPAVNATSGHEPVPVITIPATIGTSEVSTSAAGCPPTPVVRSTVDVDPAGPSTSSL